MKGRLVSINRKDKYGRVETRNDELGTLTIYFKEITDDIQENCTVEFEVATSKIGNTYAKFVSVVERNQVLFNTEDRDQWYVWGEDEENDFVEKVVPRLHIDLRINPQKARCPWAIDLHDYTHDRPADLKTQNTPFFTAGRYMYGNVPYDPTYAVTFNRKDYENYVQRYPECDIYFWVYWKQLAYRDIRVQRICGVWRASFQRMAEKIEAGEVALHPYMNRVNDDHNAKDSYVFDLRDTTVFERLV